MSNEEIVKRLHKLVDQIGKMLGNPELEGMLPTLRVAYARAGDSVKVELTVVINTIDALAE